MHPSYHTSQSQHLYQRALRTLPGGVNSPVRAFNGVGGSPIFFSHGNGAYLYDVDGNRYVDFVLSWGPLILGHAHPDILNAIIHAAGKGSSFGAPTLLEIELAETIQQLMPHLEMVRMVNSGTEAGMSVIRLARAYTGRNKIVKFDGCYHGHTDSLLVAAGSGAQTLGHPTSPGILPEATMHTLVIPYNDLNLTQQIFAQHGANIAAIIVEPIAANMNCILPQENFLPGLRSLCDQFGSLLIFDEVITGFRIGLGGAQAHFNVTPDLTMLGKVIGGGLPAAAYGGKRDIMQSVAPSGAVYQAGTLSGNPLAMAAGLATLRAIQQPHFFSELSQHTQNFLAEFKAIATQYAIPLQTTHVGGLFGFMFTQHSHIHNLHDVARCNLQFFQNFYHHALAQGIYFSPSLYEAGFISSAHHAEHIDFSLSAIAQCFKAMEQLGQLEQLW